MEIYRIKNWDENYENNRTRNIKDTNWVPVSNDLSSTGLSVLREFENWESIFGIWILLVEAASKCRPRGTLVRGDGTPYNFKILSSKIGLDEKKIEHALKILSGSEIGWIEVVPHESAARRQVARTRGTEQNRTEGTEQKEDNTYPKNISEVLAEAEKIGYAMTKDEAEKFIAHYQAYGWEVNGQKVKDWKPLVRKWKASRYEFNRKAKNNGSNKHIANNGVKNYDL